MTALCALCRPQPIEIIARSVNALRPRSVRSVVRKWLISLCAPSALRCAVNTPHTPWCLRAALGGASRAHARAVSPTPGGV